MNSEDTGRSISSVASGDSPSPWKGSTLGQIAQSLREAFHAKISRLPAKAPDLKASEADSSGRPLRPLTWFDQKSSSWRMCLPSLLEDSGLFLGRFPRSGIASNGTAWALDTLAHRTKGTASGLLEQGMMWRTPDTCAGGEMSEEQSEYVATHNLKRPSGQQHSLRLQDQVKNPKLWPTPRSSGAEKAGTKQARSTTGQSLQGAVELEQQMMWPTPGGKVHPNVIDPADLVNRKGEPLSPGEQPYDRRTGKERQTCLPDAVKLWPTPSTRDHKGGYQGGRVRNGKISRDTLDVAVQYTDNPSRTGQQLNADWVEALMGYPLGFTHVEDGSADSPVLRKAKRTEPRD